jgi:hypothetical protein
LYRASCNLSEHLDPDVVDHLEWTAVLLTRIQSSLDAFTEAAPALGRIPPNLVSIGRAAQRVAWLCRVSGPVFQARLRTERQIRRMIARRAVVAKMWTVRAESRPPAGREHPETAPDDNIQVKQVPDPPLGTPS